MNVFSDPVKEYVYKILSGYFDNMTLHKIKDDGDFSIYMAKMPCMLLNEQRFLVLMTPKDQYPPSYQKKMDEIRWVSLQTRSLVSPHPLPTQTYEIKRKGVYEKKIKITSRSKEISIYEIDDLPITISLLHVRKDEYEYPDQGTLNSALETYRTVIQFK